MCQPTSDGHISITDPRQASPTTCKLVTSGGTLRRSSVNHWRRHSPQEEPFLFLEVHYKLTETFTPAWLAWFLRGDDHE